ncbi:MAG: DUF58 domain-containing protein [Lentisphaerae bacterium]|nr:DUF58 domain-containing protein [Lentisphaerota bacterium]
MAGVQKGRIDPKVLTAIKDMELKARVLAEGVYIGLHGSPFYGFSSEFADHRQYYPGDDLRSMDWKVYARTDRYYLKRYRMESDMRVMILLDASASMGYASDGNLTKLDYGIHLAAGLSHLVIHQNDRAGLVLFDSAVRAFMPAKGGMPQLRQILHLLEQAEPGQATSVVDVCHEVAGRLGKRGLVVLISDMLDARFKDLAQCLSHFKFATYDVILMHVLDPAEIKFPFLEARNFRDLESGEEIVVESMAFQQEYRKRLEGFRSAVETQCLNARIDYELVDTSHPIEKFLHRYLSKRARMRVR